MKDVNVYLHTRIHTHVLIVIELHCPKVQVTRKLRTSRGAGQAPILIFLNRILDLGNYFLCFIDEKTEMEGK